MKVLFFLYSMSSGGAERVTANLANHWAAQGWDLTIVTMASTELDVYSLHPAVKRVSLAASHESRGMLQAVLNNVGRVRALRRALRQATPDAAVSMMTTSNVLLAIAAAGLHGIATIGSERTHPPQMPLGKWWPLLRRFFYGRLQAIAALTEETRDWLLQHTSAKRIEVIPNAVAWPMAAQAPLVPVESDERAVRKTLLAAGRLSEEKGFRRLIQVFAQLAPRFPDWDLTILGDGPERPALQQQIDLLALNNRVRMPGRAGNMAEWYEASDLFVLSSRFEGFPNALAEAMAHGLCAVSFDCDTGPRDIIRHDVDGLLVPSGNTSALQAALAELMVDDDRRRRFAQRAEEARDRFSLDEIAGRWEHLFKEARQS